MGMKYLLGGLILALIAIGLLYQLPNPFLQATVTVIEGGLVLGLAFFGLVFLLVGIEDLKSNMPEPEEKKSKKK